MIQSSLTDIDGIGKTTIMKLLQHYKSIANMRLATSDELTELIGRKRSDILLRYFACLDGKE
jgi:excinuclease UvrABC nuclease subunit